MCVLKLKEMVKYTFGLQTINQPIPIFFQSISTFYHNLLEI